jgi:hypothetical protein
VKPYGRFAAALGRFDGAVIDGAVNWAGSSWRRVADAGWGFDASVVDGVVNGTAAIVKEAGAQMRRIQTGRVRTYQMLVVGAVVALVVLILMKGA